MLTQWCLVILATPYLLRLSLSHLSIVRSVALELTSFLRQRTQNQLISSDPQLNKIRARLRLRIYSIFIRLSSLRGRYITTLALLFYRRYRYVVYSVFNFDFIICGTYRRRFLIIYFFINQILRSRLGVQNQL